MQPSIVVHADELRVVAGREHIEIREDRAHLSTRCSLLLYQVDISFFPGVSGLVYEIYI